MTALTKSPKWWRNTKIAILSTVALVVVVLIAPEPKYQITDTTNVRPLGTDKPINHVTKMPAPTVMSDGQKLQTLGELAVATGMATEYDLSVWNGSLDVTISSLLPGDARMIADAICTAARTDYAWDSHYTVRVFLPIGGDRPAASCQI